MRKENFKAISILLILCIVLSQFTGLYAFASNDNSPEISVSNASGFAGDKEVKINVNLSNNPGLVSMTLTIEFDQTVLKLVDVTDGGILGTNFHTPARTSPYTLSWANDAVTENITSNGTLATLTFEILDSAKVGRSPIKVSYEYGNYGAYNVDMKEVLFQLENGYVDVSRASCAHVFGEYKSNNDATCETDGTKTAKCTLCGESNTIVDTGSALGHKFLHYVYNNDASYTSNGTETALCEREGCNESDTREKVGSKYVDSISPIATIKIGNRSWNGVNEETNFDVVEKSNVKVTIDATDNETGIKSVEYFISNEKKTLSQLYALTTWISGSEVTVSNEGKYIVYAKITDNADVPNVTYISTCGFQIDKTSPVISGVDNGASYCDSSKTITFYDESLQDVTINGDKVSLDNGQYVLTANDSTYEIVATDKAGNATTVIVSVYADHDMGEFVSNNDATCTENGTKTSTCSHNCGKADIVIDEDSALGHKFERKIVNSDSLRSKATTTEKATYWYTCIRCNELSNTDYFEYGDVLKTGWFSESGSWYYNDADGNRMTGWCRIDGAWYYLDATKDGKMATGWGFINGKWYYFTQWGKMVTGWAQVSGKWYYFDNSGAMLTGWAQVSGKWYYFNNSGAMVTGWGQIGGKWYYFNTSGVMVTGWAQVSGKWYYFNASGAMLMGWQAIGDKWYYFNTSGAMVTGWQVIGGKWYYFNTSGAMLTGTQKISGRTYRFNSSGVWIS